VHGKEGDEFFLEDVEAARAIVEQSDEAELFLYPGTEHLFADSSLPAHDPAAAALLTERVLAFLDLGGRPATSPSVSTSVTGS
jgi:dienelactone hydrolase